MATEVDQTTKKSSVLQRLLILASMFALGAVVYVTWSFRAALSPECETTVLCEKPSPNGLFISTAFHRNCGATTNFVIGVSIRSQSKAFNPEPAQAVLLANGNTPVSLKWIGDEKLEINLPRQTTIFKANARWSTITIDTKKME
jgi:hypothetical protein